MTRDELIETALQCGVWIPMAHGQEREQTIDRLQCLVGRAVATERAACAQPHPAAVAEDNDLYWRLHAMSKSLESSGFFDEHDNPDAYGTVLDAMNFVQQHSGQILEG